MDDLDCVRLVLERAGPRSRGRSACVNKIWRVAAAEAASEDNLHWLVEADDETLRMLNIITGYEQKLELDLPRDCVPTNEDRYILHKVPYPTRVLCSFLGLLLVSLGEKYSYALILGDPLLNKWIKLPRPQWAEQPTSEIILAGFCPSSGTLVVSSEPLYFTNFNGLRLEIARYTATFNVQTVEWKVDPPDLSTICCPSTQACCVDGVFYSAFEFTPPRYHGEVQASTIACYDPVNHRVWRRVRMQSSTYFPIFLAAAQSHDRMLVYMLPEEPLTDDDNIQNTMYEAVKATGSTDLEFVRSPLMDDKLLKDRIIKFYEHEDNVMYAGEPMFYGKNGTYFWEHKDKIVILTDKDIEELNCTPAKWNHSPPSKCYHIGASGTQELMDSLESRLLSKR